ncbi:MAG: hypothetical protein HOP15_04930, partial [Planctomycetes bacterium]|nr:hypothetical protein [Planctomycetota bacterium]
IPPQQYLRSYVFFTDPTYSETNLVVVRAKTPNGFADVSLDCTLARARLATPLLPPDAAL